MVEILLVVLLALFAAIALFIWWRFDMDIADVVASSVTPAIGIGLIYVYATPLAVAGGLVLLAVGAFAFYYLLKGRERRASRRGQSRDSQ